MAGLQERLLDAALDEREARRKCSADSEATDPGPGVRRSRATTVGESIYGMGHSFAAPAATSELVDTRPSVHSASGEDPVVSNTRVFKVLGSRNHFFCKNNIRTAKYTPWNLVFKNVYEQFHKLSNFYFLLMAILQFLPFSPVTPSIYATLILIMLVNLGREAYEDYKRHKLDARTNNQKTMAAIPTHPKFVSKTKGDADPCIMPVKWADVTVGSIVLVKDGQMVPADILLLASSDVQAGIGYVETKQLDGETNMKSKECIEFTHQLIHQEEGLNCDLNILWGLKVTVDAPNANLHACHGHLSLQNSVVPINNRNIVYRGCQIQDTEWVMGLVIYSGMETKVMKNGTNKRVKLTVLDRWANKTLLAMFIIMLSICTLAACLSFVLSPSVPYLPPLYEFGISNDARNYRAWFVGFMQLFINYMILMSSMIPISLTVSTECVKVIQARNIANDERITYRDVNDPSADPIYPLVRTTNLCEDLGMVEYVLTDKTGTLTQNIMKFKKCSIAGMSFGKGITDAARASAKREGRDLAEYVPNNYVMPKGTDFHDEAISNGAWKSHPEAEKIRAFFTHLAVCHTLIPKYPDSDKTPDSVTYQASSPDELALVVGAKHCGFFFSERNYTDVTVRIGEEDQIYKILNVCEFNSTRKRMSLIVRCPDGKIRLMCKGADTVIFERLADNQRSLKNAMEAHLYEYAVDGLRTLVLAEKVISEEEYEKWNAIYAEASKATTDREKLLDDAAEEIECDMVLVGGTGIEDKLQEGMPECIADLKDAGIKVWMLTGDKPETAVNIALASNLVTPMTQIEMLTISDKSLENETMLLREAVDKLDQAIANTEGVDLSTVSLLIDTHFLRYVLEEEKTTTGPGRFLSLAAKCRTVICCRVSPRQKADVTWLVRRKMQTVTLAIGDGANDVGMIEKADIGVGISGKEGSQAIMASDYALGQFSYLSRLLLLHGRYNYGRLTTLVIYTFYKSIAFNIPNIFYGFFTTFSGIRFFHDILVALWNVVFAAYPIMIIGIWNEDFKVDQTPLAFPFLYQQNRLNPISIKTFVKNALLEGLFAGVLCFYTVYFVYRDTLEIDNEGGVLQYTSFVCLHFVVNIRILFLMKPLTLIGLTVWGLTMASYIPVGFLIASVDVDFRVQGHAQTSLLFWLCVMLCVVVNTIPVFIAKFYYLTCRNPTPSMIVSIVESNVLACKGKKEIACRATKEEWGREMQNALQRSGVNLHGRRLARPVHYSVKWMPFVDYDSGKEMDLPKKSNRPPRSNPLASLQASERPQHGTISDADELGL